jgi:hypothetical protein
MTGFILFIVTMLISASAFAIGPTVDATSIPDTQQVLRPDREHVDYFAAALYCDVRDIVSGSYGTLVGLLISMAGLYSYLMTRSGYGFFFFIAGVALTALPGIFNWYYQGTAQAFGGEDGAFLGKSVANTITLEEWCEDSYDVDDVSGKSAAVDNMNFLRDEPAEKGDGLRSLDDSEDNIGTCAYGIKDDGSAVDNGGFCVK